MPKSVSNILGAVAHVHCCRALVLHVWCSEVTRNQRPLLYAQPLVGIWQDSVALMWVPQDSSVGDSAGNGLAQHCVKEIKLMLDHSGSCSFCFVESYFGSETPCGCSVGTINGDDHQHCEERSGWADTLGKEIWSWIQTSDHRIW